MKIKYKIKVSKLGRAAGKCTGFVPITIGLKMIT